MLLMSIADKPYDQPQTYVAKMDLGFIKFKSYILALY